MALQKVPRGLLNTGVTDGSDATAITIDSSENTTFAQDIKILDGKAARFGTDQDFSIYNDNSNTYLRNSTSNHDLILLGNDDGSANTQMLKLDASAAGLATFNAGATFGGKVGIGVTDPDAELEVRGTTVISTVTDGVNSILIGLAGTNRTTIQLDTADTTHGNRQWGLTNIAGDFYVGRHGLDVMTMLNNGNVAIGATSAIDNKLEVIGNIRLRNAPSNNPQIKMNNGSVEIIGLELETGSTGVLGLRGNSLNIGSDGNVGIGTAGYGTYHTDTRVLSLGVGSTIRGAKSGADPYTTIATNAYHDASAWKHIHADFASSYEQYNGTHAWSVAASGSAGATVAFSEKMRIDASGKVGIGTSTPGTNHAKANNLVVGSGSAGGMAVFNGTNEGWYAFSRANANNSDAYDGGMSYDGSRNLKFHTNAGTTRMLIDGSGNGQFYGNWALEDSKLLMFGGSTDARIFFDGSQTLNITATNGTADTITTKANNTYIMQANGNQLITAIANSEVIINNESAAVNFRVESNDNQNAFLVDGTSNIIHWGEGTNSDLRQVIPAGTLHGKRSGYHGGQRTHSGTTYKYSEGTGWTDALKIDWNNGSWGGVCLQITGQYYYGAGNNFKVIIGFAGHASSSGTSYDATQIGSETWTNAIQLVHDTQGETKIKQRAGDTPEDVIYKYEWTTCNRSDQDILIIDL